MAKAKKPPRNDGSKGENSEITVLHQKLCLSVDMENRRIFGYTELRVAVPDSGFVGLHAENLEIESVSVDGQHVKFDNFPHYQPVEIENRWCSVSSVESAADAAGATYLSALERELVPNLLFFCPKPFEQQNYSHDESGGPHMNGKVNQYERLIRIDYWVEKAETGIHFDGKVLHTDNQIRRAHCWFPCIDDSSHSCCYHLEFTVPQDYVAVSSGSLLYQVLTKDDPPHKTYVYEVKIPVSAQWISLVVGPFQILADYHESHLSHMCLPENFAKLRNSVGFFQSAFRHFECYLDAPFPFGSYKQVFIEPDMTVSALTMGASISIFTSQILFDETVIDQNLETRVRLAYAVARQWFGVYITPETPNDGWLVEGLAGFLADIFIKEFLGNNEARYRRYKANCAVCKADICGATILSSSASAEDLYGTQSIGVIGRIRSWKSVAILQMLEKQMGPELFKGILRKIVSRARISGGSSRSLSTKEFRQYANKSGNLERPFLKEFFHRWVESCSCPVITTGFCYKQRKNTVELAACRECTAAPASTTTLSNGNPDSESKDGDVGWPGMMTIKVHELDGTHDYLLPMAGDVWQLLEIKCHSRLAAKRFQKPRKSLKADGSDDNGDVNVAFETRPSTEAPLMWVRVDPEMEYLAEIRSNQPVHMWITQLEKDRDVVAQAQAIKFLEALPQSQISVINALYKFLSDPKAFWRVRVEASFALAKMSTEENDWAGLTRIIQFYRSKRFDSLIGLPKANDFHDFSEYFVCEALPLAVASVRAADEKSPRDAVEFIAQVFKYNDNNGNPYSDAFWLASLVEAIGELEFGEQTVPLLSPLLKRIDRLLLFERMMSSYNGIVTISFIRALTQIALKLGENISLDHIYEHIKLFQGDKVMWQVRLEASRALIDLELHRRGMDAALLLFMKFLKEDLSFRGQVKLSVHMARICHLGAVYEFRDEIRSETLVSLLRLLESRQAFCNFSLRHHLFCIFQVLAGRQPTLYGVPRDQTRQISYVQFCSEQRNSFMDFLNQVNNNPGVEDLVTTEDFPPQDGMMAGPEGTLERHDTVSVSQEPRTIPEEIVSGQANHNGSAAPKPMSFKETDSASNSQDRKPVVKIRLKQHSALSNRSGEANEKSRGYDHQNENDPRPACSVSVDAHPPYHGNNYISEAVSQSNNNNNHQNLEEVNSCQVRGGSHITASIGSAKIIVREGGDGEHELSKELQCTADSRRMQDDRSPPSYNTARNNPVGAGTHSCSSLRTLSIGEDINRGELLIASSQPGPQKEKKEKHKKRKKDEHKSRKDDPEYLERKRLKKEKKQRKEMAKHMKERERATVRQPDTHAGQMELQAASNVVARDPVGQPIVSVKGSSEMHGPRQVQNEEASRSSSRAGMERSKIIFSGLTGAAGTKGPSSSKAASSTGTGGGGGGGGSATAGSSHKLIFKIKKRT